MIYVSLSACSNGLNKNKLPVMESLGQVLQKMGVEITGSDNLYAQENVYSVPATVRAENLLRSFSDDRNSYIFDVSGGDIANEIIPYINFDTIKKSKAQFWGYSDLTVIINAIYAISGKSSVLYQIRNISEYGDVKRRNEFECYIRNGDNELFRFPYKIYNGSQIKGTVIGGNIRCLLKLAGTPYFPDVDGKVLFLEALGSDLGQVITYLSQLKLMGVFDRISGVLIGTFTQLEKTLSPDETAMLVKQFSGNLPLAKTQLIGHGTDSKALTIGEEILLINE